MIFCKLVFSVTCYLLATGHEAGAGARARAKARARARARAG